jgi:hypothetical protein
MIALDAAVPLPRPLRVGGATAMLEETILEKV